ncbi:MAG TPA: amino acid ABC transporter permease [Candidatus Latescibacteria bacterium]|nr:amino acid ABC transporter permease [Candidatus Latescibacterota bacterium]
MAVGSKAFTESVILGEIVTRLARDAGARAEHQREFGGTRVLWEAVLRGDLDIYPEYTGTIEQEILAGKQVAPGEDGLRAAVEAEGLRMGRPLGFNNTYAIGMREQVADSLGIRTISDLQAHADLVLGFSNEFMDRGDGWPSLRDAYRLPQTDVRGLQHDLAYRALETDDIHAMDLYSTDAEIEYYALRVLIDDRKHFPTYNAVLIYRPDLEARAPAVVAALQRLTGVIDGGTMSGLNKRAKIDRVSEDRVAADFLEVALRVSTTVREVTIIDRLLRRTREHLTLVLLSLAAAILVAVPLGILSARHERLGQLILGVAGIIQTIPALALLVFMIPLLGIKEPPAICALFLYSLLPIVRNTYTGLTDIPQNMRESAEALGLESGVRLRLVELPLASRSILAGIKTSAVINVGFATLGAFIGAGGYGQPILTGLRLNDMSLILQGAVPAAVMALVAQGLFELSERVLVPKGLRLDPLD